MLGVGLVGSRRIWPAHVGCLVGPDGSRRIQKDRLDDQMDDQGAFDTESDDKASESRAGRPLRAEGDARPPTGVGCLPRGRSTLRAKSPPSGEARCAHRGHDRPARKPEVRRQERGPHPTPRRSRRWSGVPIRVKAGARSQRPARQDDHRPRCGRCWFRWPWPSSSAASPAPTNGPPRR
jgi:hypothetical protein